MRPRQIAALVGLLLAGCEAPAPPSSDCQPILELTGFRLGMSRRQVRATGAQEAESDPSDLIKRLDEHARFNGILLRFEDNTLCQASVYRQFGPDDYERLDDLASEMMGEVQRALGEPDRRGIGKSIVLGREHRLEIALWERACGVLIAQWNSDEDLQRVRAGTLKFHALYVSLSLLSPEAATRRLSDLKVEWEPRGGEKPH